MIRSALPRLFDIDQNIDLVRDLVKGRTFAHYKNDIALRYAVHYAVLIITEAAGKLPPSLTERHPDVPWRQLIAVGHKLRHEYFRIDPDIMWEVVTQHLAPLQRVIKLMMAAEGLATSEN